MNLTSLEAEADYQELLEQCGMNDWIETSKWWCWGIGEPHLTVNQTLVSSLNVRLVPPPLSTEPRGDELSASLEDATKRTRD